MKNDCFSRRWFFINNIFIWEIKKKFVPSSLPHRACSEYVLFDLQNQLQNLTQARWRSGHDPSSSICISSKGAWRAKSLGTICASLPPSCCEWLVKMDCDLIWPWVTSLWPLIISYNQIIADGVRLNGHDSKIIGRFQLIYVKWEALSSSL